MKNPKELVMILHPPTALLLHPARPMWQHCVVRARTPLEPFKDFESAQWTWKILMELYPDAIAAVLMPNHIHMILPAPVAGDLHRFHGFLGAMSRRKRVSKLWQPIPTPALIPDVFHLRRQIRYIALNPCRKKLCSDPLEWYWSTYRDLMGATAQKIKTASRLAGILREKRAGFEVRFHAYVSGDPSVHVDGTPFPIPVPALPKQRPETPIGEILAAAAAALRLPPSNVVERGPLRKLFVHLAYNHGWRQTSLLAEICGLTSRAIRIILSETPPPGMEAANLCLGDPRLRKGFRAINSQLASYPLSYLLSGALSGVWNKKPTPHS